MILKKGISKIQKDVLKEVLTPIDTQKTGVEVLKPIKYSKIESKNNIIDETVKTVQVEDSDCTLIQKDLNVRYDLTAFNPSTSKSESRASGGSGVLTIVYAKTGVRILLSGEVLNELGSPTKLQFSYKEDVLAISEQLPNTENFYSIKKSGKKAIIYSSPLVKEIIKYFKLDFSNKTSITFDDIKYILDADCPVAIIKIK